MTIFSRAKISLGKNKDIHIKQIKMDARIKYSVLLVGVGIILAFLPFNASKSFRLKSNELLSKSVSEEMYFSVDQVARFVNSEDSTVQIIDLRVAEEFKVCNIPGSINIPFSDLLNPLWEPVLNQKQVKNILYGNDDQTANYAWTLSLPDSLKTQFFNAKMLKESKLDGGCE